MTTLDEGAGAVAQSAGLEKAGPWLMAVYWLALLAVLALGGIASGG
jgi:hypothetical protein